MVEFEAVGKDYESFTALGDISFVVPRGGIVGLLGPNGAGKTTTMRIMTGYLAPTRGTVRFEGRPFGPEDIDVKARIGYLPESAPVYGDMLAWDYLAWEARLHGLEIDERVPAVIREVGLQSHAHMPISQLSKGYRQRVGLAHTLLHDPQLLVLDEPTSGLDPNQIIEVRTLIRRIAETRTVILSTHIMQEVEALCDRVILIHQGAIRYDGSIADFATPTQRIQLEIADAEPSGFRSALLELGGVRAVALVDDTRLTVTADPDEPGRDLRAEIFRLATTGSPRCTILEMVRERTSVEDLFHQLTQEEAHEHAN